jgi:hypothetical protein
MGSVYGTKTGVHDPSHGKRFRSDSF